MIKNMFPCTLRRTGLQAISYSMLSGESYPEREFFFQSALYSISSGICSDEHKAPPGITARLQRLAGGLRNYYTTPATYDRGRPHTRGT